MKRGCLLPVQSVPVSTFNLCPLKAQQVSATDVRSTTGTSHGSNLKCKHGVWLPAYCMQNLLSNNQATTGTPLSGRLHLDLPIRPARLLPALKKWHHCANASSKECKKFCSACWQSVQLDMSSTCLPLGQVMVHHFCSQSQPLTQTCIVHAK